MLKNRLDIKPTNELTVINQPNKYKKERQKKAVLVDSMNQVSSLV